MADRPGPLDIPGATWGMFDVPNATLGTSDVLEATLGPLDIPTELDVPEAAFGACRG